MTCVEKQLSYELVPLARGSDEHAALHPFRRMPVLEVDGLLITETLAIASYLDEAFPGPALQPPNPQARARMLTWMSVCADYLFREVVRGIPRDREMSDAERSAAHAALANSEALFEALDSGPFLVGSTLTLADLYLAPQLANCDEKAPGLLDEFPGVEGWRAGIELRESFLATTLTAPA